MQLEQPEIIVKAHKGGDFAFLFFSKREDLHEKLDDLHDAGFKVEMCTQQEHDSIVAERSHEDTTEDMMDRCLELSKILTGK